MTADLSSQLICPQCGTDCTEIFRRPQADWSAAAKEIYGWYDLTSERGGPYRFYPGKEKPLSHGDWLPLYAQSQPSHAPEER